MEFQYKYALKINPYTLLENKYKKEKTNNITKLKITTNSSTSKEIQLKVLNCQLRQNDWTK